MKLSRTFKKRLLHGIGGFFIFLIIFLWCGNVAWAVSGMLWVGMGGCIDKVEFKQMFYTINAIIPAVVFIIGVIFACLDPDGTTECRGPG